MIPMPWLQFVDLTGLTSTDLICQLQKRDLEQDLTDQRQKDTIDFYTTIAANPIKGRAWVPLNHPAKAHDFYVELLLHEPNYDSEEECYTGTLANTWGLGVDLIPRKNRNQVELYLS